MIQWWWLIAVFFPMCAVVVVVGKRSAAKAFERAWLDHYSESDQLKAEMSALRSELYKAQALAKTHREMNEQFEKERDDAWKRYHAAAIGAGNAQSMLLRSLDGAVRELNRYRKEKGEEEVSINPGIKPIVEEFKREHGADG